MPANNDITGDVIISKPTSSSYRDNYDQIFRNKEEKREPEVALREKIACNDEAQEALNRLKFVIFSEIGRVENLSAIIQFEDGRIEEIHSVEN